MDLIIQKAERHHVDSIWELVEELAIYENGRHEMTVSKEDYRRFYDEQAFEAIVALKDDEVVGTCIYYDTFSTWKGKMLYLEDFVVKESHRRTGIGDLLFEELMIIAKEKGCALAKWQVLDWNRPALSFYEKKNAIVEKEWWNCKIIF